ncbi:MAG: signal peptidase I [Bacteroidia bacterium]|nr:signal peptidase I [Bacteroidia bacterium]
MKVIFSIIYLAVIIGAIVAQWKIFTKAGKPGWACLVPIYNIIVLLEIVGRPVWWIVLFLIPIANFIALILIQLDLAKSFGKSTGFGLGLVFLAPIFILILGFGDATYVGPAAAGGAQGGQ